MLEKWRLNRLDMASVVLCTFNGARHLPHLLRSVWENGAAVGELVVADDGSTDATMAVLQEWLPRFGARMRIVQNPARLGAAANFAAALSLARCRVVLPCDQDDVWHADKVVTVLRALDADASVQVLQHDADVIDAGGRRLSGSLYRRLRAEPECADPSALFGLLLRRNRCPGCTLAIRREFLAWMLPIPPGFMHDEWIALCAGAMGVLRQVPERLIGYRVHASNALGLDRMGPGVLVQEAASGARERLGEKLQRLQVLQERLAEAAPPLPTPMATLLNEATAHRLARLSLPEKRRLRLAPVYRELASGRYRRHASGVLSALADVLRAQPFDVG